MQSKSTSMGFSAFFEFNESNRFTELDDSVTEFVGSVVEVEEDVTTEIIDGKRSCSLSIESGAGKRLRACVDLALLERERNILKRNLTRQSILRSRHHRRRWNIQDQERRGVTVVI